ncbi:hypothetical protein FGF1_16650 [Flavobacteriaceae bacterium GF1]
MQNSFNTNKNYKIPLIVTLLSLFLTYNGLYGQLIGDRSVNLGDVETYTLVRGDVTYADWDAGGVITSSNNTSATVRWNIPGTQPLVVVYETMGVSGNFSIVEIEVTVAFVPTAAPGTPSISDNGCGQALLTRNGSPPEDVDWYWQGKNPNGTHINKGKGTTFVANEGTGTYYIRAYHTGSAQWSTSSGSRYVSIVNLGAGSISGTQTICYDGNPGTLGNSASASGVSGSVSYQWQYSNNGSSGWTNISGATATTYNPPGGQKVSRWYRRRAQCASQTRYTGSVKVTVLPPLTAGNINGTQTVCFSSNPSPLGNEVSPSNGLGGYSYQWQISSNNSSWGNISGATASTYDPPGNQTATRWFRRRVISCGQTKYTGSVKVTVLPPLTAGNINGTQTVCYGGDPITLGYYASPSNGLGGYAYQWQISSNNSSWGNISGATESSYNPPGNQTATRWYRRRVISCGQTKYTPSIKVTVRPNLFPGSINGTQNLCADKDPGNLSSVSTASGGNGSYAYQWQRSTTGATSGFVNIAGATSASYAPGPISVSHWYRRQVVSCGQTKYTGTVTITVNPPPTWYADTDGDGFGDPSVSTTTCDRPPDHVDNASDQCPNFPGLANGCGYAAPIMTNANYLHVRSYQRAITGSSTLVNNNDVIERLTYYDGLGRPMQDLALKATPKGRDLVTHMEYDDYGRVEREYLPYPATGTVGQLHTTAQSDAHGYYVANYPGDIVSATPNPFSERAFEASPLDRVLKQAAPGYDWRMGGGHEVEFGHHINTASEVPYFYVAFVGGNTELPELRKGSGAEEHYATGELYKTITKDENHASTSKLHSTEEFTDKQGRVVLKRTYALVGSTITAHDTYYVYDDYGNLTYVIPPKVDTSNGVSTTELNELCYQYKYDHRNRLVEKKLPGKGTASTWEEIVYNKLDQPIMTRDPILRVQGKWLFTKYDVHGRVAYTGMVSSTSNRASLQTGANNATAQHESRRTSSPSLADETVLYSNSAYPNTLAMEIHMVNYYDSYVDTDGLTVPTTVLGQTKASNVKGLATVSKVRVLDSSATAGQADWITTLTGYDAKGRAIYTASKNTYLGTTDVVGTQLDFGGRSLKVRSAHTRTLDGVEETIVTIDNFAYDHVGRLLSQTQCIGDATLGDTCNSAIGDTSLVLSTPVTGSRTDIATSSIILRPGFHVVAAPGLSYTAKIDPQFAQELIVYNNYDELGQLVRKKVGGSPGATYDATMGLQTVKYAYNVRGWLTKINNPSSLGDDLFAFAINYNTVAHSGTKLYNGNIAETEWRTANTDSSLKWYRYGYDALNRLTSAVVQTGHYNMTALYDKNGNITELNRNGHTNATATTFGPMDRLGYSYDAGNKLTKVLDIGRKTYGFKDSTTDGQDYWYDANGNMVRDLNKGIGTTSVDGIGYNHLNLPTEVKFDNNTNKKISYIYDALGTKLKKMTYNNGVSTTTDYAGNYIYENNALQFFGHPEGYVMPNNSSGYDYVYQYKDHLGNVRLSYTDNNGTLEIIEENNYYPFGLRHKGYNNVVNGTHHPYDYQGKENQEELGLKWHDFGARNYDATLGRWTSIDAMADHEKQIAFSPYSAMANNPNVFIDPDGNCFTKSENDEYVPCEEGSVGDTRQGAFGYDWTYTENDGWQLTNGADPDSVEAEYTEETLDGSADYYINRYKKHIEKYGTRPPDYYLGYGHKYNVRFTNETRDGLSETGKEWLDQTSIELQVLMEEALRENPSIELNNETFQKFAFESHVPAYSKGDKLFNLGMSDKLRIMVTPNFSDSFGSGLGRAQIGKILNKQLLFNSFKSSPSSLYNKTKNPTYLRLGGL